MTYRNDLAHIYDSGFSGYALSAAPGILRHLRNHDADRGLVVDLGCGTGTLARQLGFAGYQVCGIDQSSSMIRLARRNAPKARFVKASLLEAKLPRCSAVTCIGETLSFAMADASEPGIEKLFRRIFRSLIKGGIFLFDFGQNGVNPGGMPKSGHWLGTDWAVCLEAEPFDESTGILTRKLTTFLKSGGHYRRKEETHRLRLFESQDMAERAARAGFETRILRSFGELRFQSGHGGVFARRP